MIELGAILLIFVLLLGIAPTGFVGLRNASGIFIAYSIAGIFIPAILSLATGQPGPYDVVSLLTSFGLKAIGISALAFFVTVYTAAVVGRIPVPVSDKRFFSSSQRTAIYCAVLSVIFSVLYIATMALQFGSLAAIAARLYQRTNFEVSSANILQTLTLGAFVFAIFAVVFARGLRGKVQVYAWGAVAVFFMLCLLLGGRSNLGLLVVAIFYLPFIRMRVSRAVLGVAAAVALFGVASYAIISFRTEAQGGASQATSIADRIGVAARGLTYVDHIAAAVEYASVREHDRGQVYLNVLTSPVPRDLWPSKPLPISIEMRSFLFGDTQGGAPPGLLGEAFIAFGTLGSLGAAALLGFLLGKVNSVTNLALQFDCRLRTAIAGIAAPLVAFSLVRGGFDASTTRITVTAAFTVLAAGVCFYTAPARGRQQRRAYPPPGGTAAARRRAALGVDPRSRARSAQYQAGRPR
jgi:hypothetical protein